MQVDSGTKRQTRQLLWRNEMQQAPAPGMKSQGDGSQIVLSPFHVPSLAGHAVEVRMTQPPARRQQAPVGGGGQGLGVQGVPCPWYCPPSEAQDSLVRTTQSLPIQQAPVGAGGQGLGVQGVPFP